MDIEYENRKQVIHYLREKYGNLAHICTFGTIGIRSAIKDAGRALGMSYQLRDEISKAIPEDAKTLEEALEKSPVLQEYKKNFPDLFRFAEKIQNMPRHVSTHASGVVISPEPLENYMPLFVDKDGELVTQFEMNNVAELGLVKFDILG